MKKLQVLSLGAGVQSTTLLLMSIRGTLPRRDAAVFADTQYEPPEVYKHLDWLEGVATDAGIPVHRVTAGNLREDALEFRQHRKSADGRRFASLPMFVKNPDGSMGRLPRQCTSEYKIEPLEEFYRRELLGLKPRQHAPKEVVIEQWFGITDAERRRAKPPGVYERSTITVGQNLLGEDVKVEAKIWKPQTWKSHIYPFLDLRLMPDRSQEPLWWLDSLWDRSDCVSWLRDNYQERAVPRSACICCPFRTNDEWRSMRDNDPASWEEACRFDDEVRLRDEVGLTDERLANLRKPLVGTVYTHRSLVPLRMVDLSSRERGDGPLFDQPCEGMCGL